MGMKKMNLLVILVLVSTVTSSFTGLLRNVLQLGKAETDSKGITYPILRSGIRSQPQIPHYIPFPCNVTFGRSRSAPDSVHRLRPGDIDIVGGLGDSLVAGSGALEEYAIGTFIEARGVSWCVGGQGDWRRFLTVPNLLKVFNPNLSGYSTGTGEFISGKAKLNIAFPVAATEDALQQARILVQRIKSDPKVDVKRQWKLVTIFFGANDICSAQCFNPAQFSPVRYALHLRRALDFLKIALPRTLVNLVPVIDVTVSIRVPRSAMCSILHPLYCACMHRGSQPSITASKMVHLYQQAVESLISSGRSQSVVEQHARTSRKQNGSRFAGDIRKSFMPKRKCAVHFYERQFKVFQNDRKTGWCFAQIMYKSISDTNNFTCDSSYQTR
ncbi:phospholipase B1, membrane-associated isoform X2 [Nomia melanderi]|uniref:phospholipase B1, membrane-associated isoform X2 n=1 Tax=Nomia melanderi TaxID=2448451 RepID=UPI003FCC4408